MTRIGVLALQGAFIEHINMLRRIGVEAVEVRLPQDLKNLDGLVMPGGESTTIGRLLRRYELVPELEKQIAAGLPILGTCAGMILLAKEVIGLNGHSFRTMDIKVRRNAFGRQVESFETSVRMPILGDPPIRAIFIRSPRIEGVGAGVEVLAKLPSGTPVAARQGNMVVASFHPELTDDTRFHSYFISIADGKQ